MTRSSGAVLLLLLVLAAAVCVHGAFYDKKSGVISLNSKNFDQIVKKDNTVTLVEFYAPWCGHCKALQPEYVKAAQALKGLAQVAAVDCDADKTLPGQYGVQGFPTLKLFIGKNAPKDYPGQRTAAAITEWVSAELPSLAKKVTAKNAADFLAKPPAVPKALLFTKKKSSTPLFKAMSLKFAGRMLMGEVHESEKALVEQYAVTAFPTLLVFPPKAADATEAPAPIRFDEPLTPATLAAFLKTHALPAAGGEDEDDSGVTVPELADQSCLQLHCVDESGLCAVVVLSGLMTGAEAKAHLERFKQAAAARDDSFYRFVWINSTAQPEFVTKAFGWQQQAFPQVAVLAAKKNRFTPYIGAYTLQGLKEFLDSAVRTKPQPLAETSTLPALVGDTVKCVKSKAPEKEPEQHSEDKHAADEKPHAHAKKEKASSSSGSGEEGRSVPLTAAQFEQMVLASPAPWIVEFFAPWCGHCKALAPEWAKAAANTKNMVHFGAVDATVESALAQKFDIKGYPTIKVFPAGLTGDAKAKKVSDYTGARSAVALQQFALGLLSSKLVKKVTGGADAIQSWVDATATQTSGHVVLFSNKAAVPPLLSALSMEFAGQVSFAFVPHTEEALVAAFNVTAFPSIVLLQVQADGKLKAESYTGTLSMSAISKAIVQVLKPKAAKGSSGSKGAEQAEQSDEPEQAVPAGPLLERPLSQADFVAQCTDRLGVCVLAFVTQEMLEDGDDKPIVSVLESVAQHYREKGTPLHFLYMARGAQTPLVNALDVSDSAAANVVVFKAGRGSNPARFANYIGAWSVKGLQGFLDDVLASKVGLVPIKKVPELLTVAAPAAAAADTVKPSAAAAADAAAPEAKQESKKAEAPKAAKKEDL